MRAVVQAIVEDVVHMTPDLSDTGELEELAGMMPELTQGQPLLLQDDPTNPYNVDAVRVCDAVGTPLGYVPDLLLNHLAEMRATVPSR